MSVQDTRPRLIAGRYRLDDAVGRGGMGTVWRGHDELLDRPVAVKEVRFPPEVGPREQSDLRERTLREARATARLSHPNVVTTYDVVEEDRRPWIVMELLDARSLSEILRDDGPVTPDRVAGIGLQLLDALEVSHGLGIVHRDVKPGNVLVTSDGRVVLTDFGIATMSGDPSLTSTGVVLGSPAYMPPERARGQRPGPAADLWSLGATLHAAVEGRPPYERDTALGTLTAVITEPLEPLSIDGPLAEAIRQLLEKDPAARPGIGAVRTLLQRAAADPAAPGQTQVMPALGALERGGRTQALSADVHQAAAAPAPGRRASTILVFGLALLVLVGTLAALAARGARNDPRDTTAPAPATRQASPARTSAGSTPAASSPSGGPVADGVPRGFRRYTDPTGFSIAVPAGWRRVQKSETAVDFREPGGFRFLRVDQTDKPKDDPVQDWTRQEKRVSARLGGYERIRIEEVDYRDYEAADWEFTYRNTHVLNRGMVTGRKGYALYWSTPSSQWAESRRMFEVFAATFRPADHRNGGRGKAEAERGD